MKPITGKLAVCLAVMCLLISPLSIAGDRCSSVTFPCAERMDLAGEWKVIVTELVTGEKTTSSVRVK